MKTRFRPNADGELVPTRVSLIERMRDLEDAASWQEFFDTYWKLIYCAALKFGMSDQEAEDIVQETIIGIARRMPTFRYEPQSCSFKGWLMHVTRARIIDRLRKRQKQGVAVHLQESAGTTGGTEMEIPDPAAEHAFEEMWSAEWENNLIDAAMDRVRGRINPQHYQIFFLRSVKNMPASDIAELIGVSVAKIYVVQHRVARLVKSEVDALEKSRGGLP